MFEMDVMLRIISEHITRFLLCFVMKYEVVLHVSGITHARLAVRWVHSAELPNSTGTLSSLSESFIFPMVFNVFQEAAMLCSVDDQECR